jgi:hypothetical protein
MKERAKKFGIKPKVKLMDLYVLQELVELFQGLVMLLKKKIKI